MKTQGSCKNLRECIDEGHVTEMQATAARPPEPQHPSHGLIQSLYSSFNPGLFATNEAESTASASSTAPCPLFG